MPPKSYRSDQIDMGVRIATKEINTCDRLCAKAAGKEIGGILVGYYSDDLRWAQITQVLPPPLDSKGGPTWFHRGTNALQEKIDKLWKRKRYYLGEWHYHPVGDPVPSGTDVQQMMDISNSKAYHCPEPILLVLSMSTTGLRHGWYLFRERRRFFLEPIKVKE